MDEEIKLEDPNLKIHIDKDGIPCMLMAPVFPQFEIRFFEFPQFQIPHNNFTELQQQREKDYLENIIKELEKLFKDW